MKWLVWVQDEMTRDEAIAYDEMFAGGRDHESSAHEFAEMCAEVVHWRDAGETSYPYTMNVAVVGDDGVDVELFEFTIDIEYDPTFTATKRDHGKE